MISNKQTWSVGWRMFGVSLVTLLLGGCASYSTWLPGAGPATEAVQSAATSDTGIQIVQVDSVVALKLQGAQRRASFSEQWGSSTKPVFTLGAGDVVEVSVWEAPPVSLFGISSMDFRSGTTTSRVSVLPEQMVAADGNIEVPFVGPVRADGRTTSQVQADIVAGLKGKANQPQVLVRQIRNSTSMVTVVGEVNTSVRMPLTAKGERLLDALAAAGGTRQPVGKISIQVTRGRQVLRLPLDAIVADPEQNIVLQPGDVLTALHQPFNLTVLGATGANRELEFEAQGISLAQALGRTGGLQDQRADARGLFIFRFEDPALVPDVRPDAPRNAQGLIAVVYQVDLKDPASFFAAQDFPMRHRDVVYVANAPAAELQKFLNIVGSVIGPARVLQDVVNN